MICKDLKYYYEHKNYQALRDLHVLLEEDLYDFIKNDPKLLEQKEAYELPESYFDEQDRLMDIEFDFPEILEDVQDIEKYAQHYLYMDKGFLNLQESIIKTNSEVFKQLQKENCDYLEPFLESESLPLILSFYKEHTTLAENLSSFCRDLIVYALKKENLEIETAFVYVVLISYATLCQNEMTFTLDTLKTSIYTQNLEKENLQKILNSDLFIRQVKWISFVHPYLQIYGIAVAISLLGEEDKQEIYSNILFSFSPYNEGSFAFENDFIKFCEILIEVDSEGFKDYCLKSYIHHFLHEVKEENEKNMAFSFFKFFYLSLHLDHLNYKAFDTYGYSYTNEEVLNLFELFFGSFSLTQYITPEAFIAFKSTFKNRFYKDKMNVYTIDLYKLVNDDSFYDWLEKYGLKDVLVQAYQKIKQLEKVFSKATYTNFKDYAKDLDTKLIPV